VGNVVFFLTEIVEDMENPVKIVEFSVFELLVFMSIWSHLRTMFTLPGYVKKDKQLYIKDKLDLADKTVLSFLELEEDSSVVERPVSYSEAA
jgi:hypothetical protein